MYFSGIWRKSKWLTFIYIIHRKWEAAQPLSRVFLYIESIHVFQSITQIHKQTQTHTQKKFFFHHYHASNLRSKEPKSIPHGVNGINSQSLIFSVIIPMCFLCKNYLRCVVPYKLCVRNSIEFISFILFLFYSFYFIFFMFSFSSLS